MKTIIESLPKGGQLIIQLFHHEKIFESLFRRRAQLGPVVRGDLREMAQIIRKKRNLLANMQEPERS